VVIERNSKTKKPDMKLDKAMMHTINKYLTDNNILEYICIDLVRVTSNRNWSIFCKYKANAKMLTHEKIKLSRITNDMLLGAIAASTGLWVIGITVTIGYLVITA
jgi:Pyruvate/2-oxoacid:ferredoxin oxidoreductase gamma subunit